MKSDDVLGLQSLPIHVPDIVIVEGYCDDSHCSRNEFL